MENENHSNIGQRPYPNEWFPSAEEDSDASTRHADTPQTQSHSYKLAFLDDEFLKSDDMRPLRLQLELKKPEVIQQRENIVSTVVIFGGTRIWEKEKADAALKEAEQASADNPSDPELKRQVSIARRRCAKSVYYDEARKLARMVSSKCQVRGICNFAVVTGGGPGIMEAANRGAFEIGAKSIGLNIVLPFEQEPNHFITPQLCFQFHYFAIRKMHFLMRAKALICFPGGFGTLDELFEALTLIQTGKVNPIPVLLFGREFWEKLIDFDFLVEEGTISPKDLNIFKFVETADEAWQEIAGFYRLEG